jgi:hypothetical protein
MNERPGPYTQRPRTEPSGHGADRPRTPARRSLGIRVLGWTLLTASVGLVSCQSLFAP